jgi:hypothetical protein
MLHVLVGLGSCIVLSLCASRDFMMGNREKYTLFADIIVFCIFTSSSFPFVNSAPRVVEFVIFIFIQIGIVSEKLKPR